MSIQQISIRKLGKTLLGKLETIGVNVIDTTTVRVDPNNAYNTETGFIIAVDGVSKVRNQDQLEEMVK